MDYKFINDFGINDDLKEKIITLSDKSQKKILKTYNKVKSDGFASLYNCNNYIRLAVVLLLSEDTFNQYKALEINENIFFDSMKDISVWCENNNNNGLKNIGWIKNHLKPNLFRIGRLQFQMFTYSGFVKDQNGNSLRGKNMVYIHIPQGEKLNYDDCLKSIEMARLFFNTYFADFHYDYFYCESWLLYSKNKEFMDENSNIIKFQSLFDIVYSKNDDAQAIERIFGKRQFRISSYDATTTLQKNAIAYMKNGNKMGIGVGLIEK